MLTNFMLVLGICTSDPSKLPHACSADLHLFLVAGLTIDIFFAYQILDIVQKWTELLDEFLFAISGHDYLPQQLYHVLHHFSFLSGNKSYGWILNLGPLMLQSHATFLHPDAFLFQISIVDCTNCSLFLIL